MAQKATQTLGRLNIAPKVPVSPEITGQGTAGRGQIRGIPSGF